MYILGSLCINMKSFFLAIFHFVASSCGTCLFPSMPTRWVFLPELEFFFLVTLSAWVMSHTHTHITAIGGQTSSRIPVWDPTGTLLLVQTGTLLGPYYLSVPLGIFFFGTLLLVCQTSSRVPEIGTRPSTLLRMSFSFMLGFLARIGIFFFLSHYLRGLIIRVVTLSCHVTKKSKKGGFLDRDGFGGTRSRYQWDWFRHQLWSAAQFVGVCASRYEKRPVFWAERDILMWKETCTLVMHPFVGIRASRCQKRPMVWVERDISKTYTRVKRDLKTWILSRTLKSRAICEDTCIAVSKEAAVCIRWKDTNTYVKRDVYSR